MAYATVDDMVLALGEAVVRAIGDFTGDIVADDPNILAALDEASSICDSFIGGHVTQLPVPASLRRATVNIAAYLMAQAKDMVTSARQEGYDDAISWLRAIASGEIDPGWVIVYPPVPPDEVTPQSAGDPEVSGLQRVWSRITARGVF